MAEKSEYRDLLQEGLSYRVKRYLEQRGDNLPDDLKDIPLERLINNINSLAIGRLNTVIDTFIDSAFLNFLEMVQFSKKREGKK